MWYPTDVCVDSEGNVWVADSGNLRVLRFKAPVAIGQVAETVIGQKDFLSVNRELAASKTKLGFVTKDQGPEGVAVDNEGNVWVADSGNVRALKFNAPIPATGASADIVLGQPNFTDHYTNQNYNAESVGPSKISIDRFGNVWAADHAYCRVLKFNKPVSATGESADLVIGQKDFISHDKVEFSEKNNLQNNLFEYAKSVAIDEANERIYVGCGMTDQRILWWNNYTTLQNGQAADGVIGRPDFSSNGFLDCSQTSVNEPLGICVDSQGSVWVADALHHRVLKFNKPTSNGEKAVLVLGQPNFTSHEKACTQSGMWYPSGVCVDKEGNVWVADSGNNRVLKFVYRGK